MAKLSKLPAGKPPRLAKKSIKPAKTNYPSTTTGPIDAPPPRVTTMKGTPKGPSQAAM